MNKKLYIFWGILVILLIFLVVYLFNVNKKLNTIYENMQEIKKMEVIDSKGEVSNEVLGDNESIDNKVIEENIENDVIEVSKEELVINSLNETLNSIDNIDKLSIKNRSKEIYNSIVDFLLYDGEINGVTFNELSEKGKENILNIINKIEVKLEIIVPKYKDSIASNSKYLFDKVSEVIKNFKK